MIISTAHSKGGVGKTTTALNLAAILKPDIIIDQDLHKGLSVLNEHRKHPYNVLSGHNSKELIAVLREANETNKLVIIDCGGFDSDINRKAIAASDLVIVPANDGPTEVIGLTTFDKTLSEISREFDVEINAKLLLTRVNPNRKYFDDIESFVAKSTHMTKLNGRLPARKEYASAMYDALGVTEHKATKYSVAARDVKAVAKRNKKSIVYLINIYNVFFKYLKRIGKVFMSKKGFFDKLESTETNAALKEQQISEPKKAQPAVKPKHLNAMPTVFFNAHKKGKNGGHTSLDFSQYIYEAVREKLQRDGLL